MILFGIGLILVSAWVINWRLNMHADIMRCNYELNKDTHELLMKLIKELARNEKD